MNTDIQLQLKHDLTCPAYHQHPIVFLFKQFLHNPQRYKFNKSTASKSTKRAE